MSVNAVRVVAAAAFVCGFVVAVHLALSGIDGLDFGGTL